MANSIHDLNGSIEAPKASMPTEGVPSSLVETMMRKDMDKDTPPSQDFGR